MQVKLLHDLVEEMAGEGTGRIVEILFKKKDVNEFLIAKRMELTINQVRNILYKLSADNLVSFIRKKDKRKGWYIYYWTLNTEKCLAKLEGSLEDKIKYFEVALDGRETKRFYTCKACDIEVGEEVALERGFSCEECADIYELSDNAKPIREIKARISRIKKNLILIHGELEEVRKKSEIARKRASNKLSKETKIKTDLIKAARSAARKKVNAVRGGRLPVAGGRKAVAVKKKVVKKVAKRKVVKKVVKKTTARKNVPSKKGTKVPVTPGKRLSLASKLKKKISGKK